MTMEVRSTNYAGNFQLQGYDRRNPQIISVHTNKDNRTISRTPEHPQGYLNQILQNIYRHFVWLFTGRR
ncbi:MAG: hypothetical protein ABIE74_03815 [Pseudomonadota bacterium]